MRILVLYVQITAFSQCLENEGPIDDAPLNKYVYNMHLFMITLLCKYFFEDNDVTKLFWTPRGYFSSSLPILVLVCDSYLKHDH